MTAKEKEDAINELTAYIHCLKCDRSGKVCDDNCPTQYEAGNCGEIIKNLEFLLEEVKKMPIQPKAKVGHWIKVVEVYLPYICSECDKPEFRKSNYCPNCGAEMMGVEEYENVKV